MFLLALGGGCQNAGSGSRQVATEDHELHLGAGDLEVVVRDNHGTNGVLPGYNGIASLRHRAEPKSLFVPRFSGLNLEHIFDGERPADRSEFFEPRTAPMELTRLSESSAELYQPTTPNLAVESRTVITIVAPHYIDFEFECTPRGLAYAGDFLGLFWASYIDAPQDLALYAVGHDPGGHDPGDRQLRWLRHASESHGDRSTLRHADEERRPAYGEAHGDLLYASDAPQRYEHPFFYGRSGKMVFVLMLDRSDGMSFAMSPTGGGRNADGSTNPAWDWQWCIFGPESGRRYGFEARIVYKPWVSRADVLAEYEAWSGIRVGTAAHAADD